MHSPYGELRAGVASTFVPFFAQRFLETHLYFWPNANDDHLSYGVTVYVDFANMAGLGLNFPIDIDLWSLSYEQWGGGLAGTLQAFIRQIAPISQDSPYLMLPNLPALVPVMSNPNQLAVPPIARKIGHVQIKADGSCILT